MTYAIVTNGGSCVKDLTATTDTGAIRQMRKYLRESTDTRQVFLEFYRASDGQSGYLNPPDGDADVTGRSWR